MTIRQSLQEGYRRSENSEWLIIANHDLPGVTPEMLDWWWDHIDSTARYQLWHPTDHVSFEWLLPPTNGHVGAIQRVAEYLNGLPETPATFDIRWDDARDADTEYPHVLLATAQGQGELAGLRVTLMHEYEKTEIGTRMRSHFHLPPQTPEIIVAALYEHNRQEMAFLPTFLPNLYHAESQTPSKETPTF